MHDVFDNSRRLRGNDVAGLLSWVEKLWAFYTAVVGLSSIIGTYSEMFVQMLENGLN